MACRNLFSRQIQGCLLFLLLLLAGTVAVHAHNPGLSSGYAHLKTNQVVVEVVYALGDVETIFLIDRNTDGRLDPQEISDGTNKLKVFAEQALTCSFDGHPQKLPEALVEIDDQNNCQFRWIFPARPANTLEIVSRWVEIMPTGHQQIFTVKDQLTALHDEWLLTSVGTVVEVRLKPTHHQKPLVKKPARFGTFFRLGLKHIITGYDHLLFLFGLLLVCTRPLEMVKIITAFTVAHSLTLVLATLGWITVSSRWVEPLIAASIIFVGIDNLLNRDKPKNRVWLTFAFGLVHGLGFAGLLEEMNLARESGGVLVPLFSFNLGVEAGQLAIAALILPVILRSRRHPNYQCRWLPVLSVMIATAGGFWLIQRVIQL